MAEQTKKKIKALDKIKANPSAKLKDNASSAIDKINSKTKGLSRAVISPTAKLNDHATSKLNRISTTIKKLNNTNVTANLRINDQTSTYLNKVHAKTDKLKNTNINPTAKIADQASEKLEKIKQTEDKLKDKKLKIQAQDGASSTINKIENKVNGWIKAGAKKIISIGIAGTVALGGLGIGSAIKTFSSYEQGLSGVKAVTNATDAQMKQLGDTAKSLGASTAWSASETVKAEELLGQAGFSVQETITSLPGLLSLASAGGLDLASATDIASGTLRAFSLSASETGHVADVLALSASATNSDVTDLGESMKYCAPVSQALGISLEDTAAATGLLSNANIKGSSAGTILRQTMARLASPTKEASKMMKQYGINAFDAQGNMKPLSGVVDNLKGSLSKLTSQQRADVISTVFGTESMSGVLALMNQGGQSLSDLSQKLKDAKGAADKMAETRLDNLAGQWEQLKGAAETMQINLGERLAPYAKEFITWLTGKMPEIENKVISIVDYLSKHTGEIKSLATTIIGVGAAFAGLSAVGSLGNTITGITSLVGILKGAKVAEETAAISGGLKNIGLIGRVLPALISPAGLAIAGVALVAGTAITANNNLMKKSLSTTTEELGPVEKIMNKLNGTIYKSKSEMIDLGLVYDDFGNGVSDNFKTAAQNASKSLLQIEMNIRRLTRDGILDEAENNQLKNWVNDFANEGINALKEKQSQIKSEFEKTFSLDGKMSDAEQGVMDYLGSYFEEGVNKQLSIRDEVYKIGDKAIKDHGKILDSDMQNIRDKLAELKAIQLEYANAESAGERAYASSKFTSKAERVTGIKGASELLQERSKEHQSQKDETKANYDKTITTTQYLMEHESNADKKAKLQKGLSEATTARDKALKEAEESWQVDLETVYKYYPNAKENINKYTGAELTGGDKRSQNSLEKMKSKYADMNNITQSGFYAVRDSVTGAMNSMYVSVDERTGDIVGAWNTTTGAIGAYTTDIKGNVKELGNVHQNTLGGAIDALARMGASYDATKGAIVNFSGEAIGPLQNVTTAADRTRTGILNLNGTPLQITSNAAGQILSITEVGNTTDKVNGKTANVTINDNGNEAKSRIAGAGNEADRVNGKTSTITIRTVYENVVKWVKDKLGIDNNASGTDFSKEGFSTVNERGWELSESKSVPIFGEYNNNPVSYLSKGTKILNHMQSVQNMKEEVSKQVDSKVVNQPKQIQYQLIKPQQQVQIAGVGGVNFGDIKVSVEGNQDVDNIVTQAAQEFARKLKESLGNIKK
jgi:phage tail tape measure protein, TP901 family, core region